MDSYQPVYDAIRSKFHMPDIGDIISRSFDISWQIDAVKNEFVQAACEMQRPCVIFKPELFQDGDHWCALLGKDLATGIAGFGKSPALAMWDFDKAWNKQLEAPHEAE